MNQLTHNGTVIQCLCRSFRQGVENLTLFPKLLFKTIDEDCWQRFVCEATNEERSYNSFEEFVAAPAPYGLTTTIQQIKNVCRDEPAVLDAIDKVLQNKHGGNHNPVGVNQHTIPQTEEVKFDNVTLDQPVETTAPTGNSRDQAIRRLRKSRPDLHKKVVDGEMSAHAAALDAGFRKRPKPIDTLKKTWDKATVEEKEEFLEWIK
jgi:hypothetical protein